MVAKGDQAPEENGWRTSQDEWTVNPNQKERTPKGSAAQRNLYSICSAHVHMSVLRHCTIDACLTPTVTIADV